jgi:hypothetical protein
MKIYTIEIRTISNDSVVEIITTIKDLFDITNILDKSDNVIEYKVGGLGVTFPHHPAGSQTDKLVEKFDWSKTRPYHGTSNIRSHGYGFKLENN